MPEPRSRRLPSRGRHRVRFVGIAVLVVVATGCTTSPPIAQGTFAAEQQRIVALVNATGAAVGAPLVFTPATKANRLPCYKKMLGYTVKHLAANHAEVPLLMTISGNAQGPSLLPRVERYWKSRGYVIDRSGLSDPRFPKLRAHVGDDLLVATGYTFGHNMTLYGVTPCVRS